MQKHYLRVRVLINPRRMSEGYGSRSVFMAQNLLTCTFANSTHMYTGTVTLPPTATSLHNIVL